MNIRNEIKAQIVRAGFTMQELVDRLSDEYDWSDSVSNLSAKLQRESIRYKEVVELADVLGYDIVWQKRRDIPGVEIMRTKLKKYDKTYKELTAENATLEQKLNSASRESIQKKLEIQRKLSELDELRRTVDAIPDEVIRAYSAQRSAHHSRMKQEI